jgi:CMP-N-acetylneuraminic acid synthetase
MRRQDLPPCFKPNGAIYAIRTKAFSRNNRLLTTKTLPFIMSPEKSKEIDTPRDLLDIEKLLIT